MELEGAKVMQMFRTTGRGEPVLVGSGVRVLLLSSDADGGPIANLLAGMGCQVDVVDELFYAMSEVIDDPAGHALFVVDCDSVGVGGLAEAQRAVQMLGVAQTRVPVILVSRECCQQRFPDERMHPTVLRAPVSAVSLKMGFEHALRDRLMCLAA